MISGFEFATATQIVFGRGTSAQLGTRLSALGKRALCVTGTKPERWAALLESVAAKGVALVPFTVSGEPTIELAEAASRLVRSERCDCVLGLGGGSVIDLAKAAAALAPNPGAVLDYVEVIGHGKPLSIRSLPFVAVPTTSGTGAEVTKNAVLGSVAHGVKVSLRSDSMLPTLALVDSALSLSVPRETTAATGLDALTQVIEPFVSHQANPLVDALCLDAIERARNALPRVWESGQDEAARDDMALVSLFGGLALANAKLGAVHGFAGPIGGMVDAPHGAVCARLLPLVTAANYRALLQRAPQAPARLRYERVARLLTGDPQATVAAGVQWLTALSERLGIPGLASYGLSATLVPQVVAKAERASSMKGNPIPLETGELTDILMAAL